MVSWFSPGSPRSRVSEPGPDSYPVGGTIVPGGDPRTDTRGPLTASERRRHGSCMTPYARAAAGGRIRRHMAARLPRLLVALWLLLGVALPSAATAVVRPPTSQETGTSPVPARGGHPAYARSYFGARYYRANLGRFTTVDPELNVNAALLDPQRWNRYAYARNNPLRWVDLDGRDATDQKPGACPTDYCETVTAPMPRDEGLMGWASRNFLGLLDYFTMTMAVQAPGLGEADRPLVDRSPDTLVLLAATLVRPGRALSALTITREMHATARVIARGGAIRKVAELVAKFGGQAKNWTKMSTVDAAGREIHWYQHPSIGKVGIKLAGEPDPF
jgi:RHS repeat-associated protein